MSQRLDYPSASYSYFITFRKVYDRVGAPGSRRRTTIRASLLPDQDITTVEITDESSEDEEQKEEGLFKNSQCTISTGVTVIPVIIIVILF